MVCVVLKISGRLSWQLREVFFFIDEAYSLKSDTAITVLLQEMENQRGRCNRYTCRLQ